MLLPPRIATAIPLSSLLVVAMVASADPPAGEPDRAQLLAQIAQLERKVALLEQVVEGTARPINLGRTSLAAVSASSVNGGRALDNIIYGVPNAFDGGENWHNKINYTYWLAGGGAGNWIEVQFDHPVTVTEVQAEGAPRFAVAVTFAKGGEQRAPVVEGGVKFGQALHGVSRVRLTFEAGGSRGGGSNTSVDEVIILGHAPPGVEFEVARPRVLITRINAEAIAQERFQEWRQSLTQGVGRRVDDDGQRITVTYSKGDIDMVVYRVIVDKATGEVTTDARVELAPVPEAADKTAPGGAPAG